MQTLDDTTFDHVVTWQVKNFILQLSRRLQPPNLVGIYMRTK